MRELLSSTSRAAGMAAILLAVLNPIASSFQTVARRRFASPTLFISTQCSLSSKTRFALHGSDHDSDRFLMGRIRRFSSLDDFLDGGDFDRLIDEQMKEQENALGEIPDHLSSAAATYGWRKCLNDNIGNLEKVTAESLPPSPVEQRMIGERNIWIKRDDLLRLSNSGISGNKARKMWTLDRFPASDFPSCIVSYGGPQSNSMLALAAIVNAKNREITGKGEDRGMGLKEERLIEKLPPQFRFIYYTKTLPRFLRNQPSGNLFRAMTLGMELKEVLYEEYKNLFEEHHRDEGQAPMDLKPPTADSLWVPQGGAFASAQAGTAKLAHEIYEFWKRESGGRPLTICVPGGTCTTAVLLHHHLRRLLSDQDDEIERLDIEVVVIPCVGDNVYANRQMISLSMQVGTDGKDIPTVLPPAPESKQPSDNKYFTFGKPHKEVLDTFLDLRDNRNLVVDLLYGAPSLAILLRHLKELRDETFPRFDASFDPNDPLSGREIMYVHSGGLEGINSQLLRYKYEGLVEIEDVQLPGRTKR